MWWPGVHVSAGPWRAGANHWNGGGTPVRIVGIETVIVGNPWKNWVFALVHTDEGITGLGEGSATGSARTIATAIDELAPLVVGEDPTRIEWVTRRLIRDVY